MKPRDLDYHLRDGCCVMANLGKAKVPDGFAVIQLDEGYGHFLGLGPNGEESNMHCDKWAVLRWCKFKAEQLASTAREEEKL